MEAVTKWLSTNKGSELNGLRLYTQKNYGMVTKKGPALEMDVWTWDVVKQIWQAEPSNSLRGM